MSVNVGEVSGVIKLADEFTKPLLAAAQGLVDFQSNLDKASKRLSTFGTDGEKSTRKVKDETAKLQKEYQRLAMQLDPVYAKTVRYEKAQTTLNNALKAGVITQAQYNQRLTQLQGPLQQAEHWTTRLGRSVSGELTSSFTRFFAISAAIGFVGTTLSKVFDQLVQATLESEQAQQKLQFAFNRSGNASGFTAKEAAKLADTYSRLTGIDDEIISDALVIESRFNRLSGDVFKRVIESALDMSAATGEAVPAAMEKAARMVNNPLRALTLLNREGYAVGASQTEMVKSFLRANDVIGAQGVILDILESQYGDTAAEMRDTLGGALKALSTSWENLLEKLSEDRTGPLREGIEKLISLIETLTDNVDNLTIGWHNFNIVSNEVLATITKMHIGASEGPLARFLNPKGAAKNTAELKKNLSELEDAIAESGNALANIYLKRLGLVDEGHKKTGKSAHGLTSAEKKLSDSFKASSEAMQKVNDEIEKLKNQAIDQESLYNAATKGLESYNEEVLRQKVSHAILEKEAELRKTNQKLTEQQRKEIETSIRAIDLFGKKTKEALDAWSALSKVKLDNIEVKVPDLTKVPTIQKSIMEIGISFHASVNDDFEREWSDFAASVREGIKTDKELLEEYKQNVIAASQLEISGKLSAIELEKELGRIRMEQFDQALEGWGTLFGQLGNMFGGFFQQLAQSISNIQSALQAGQKLDASGFGGSMAGAFGGIFATAAIFHEVYKLVSADIKRERARTFSEITSLSVSGGEWSSPSYISQAGRELEAALRDLVRQISDSLGGILKELPKITIRARKDGKEFSAYVAGLWVGTFRDAQSALEQGVASAIQQADFEGVSQEFVQALQRSIGATLDELEANIETARAARRARIGEVGEQYVDISDQWRQEIRAMEELGLAIDDAVAARDRELAALKNNVLGIDTAVSDQLRALGSLSAGIAESADDTRAVLQQQIDDALNQIARLQSRGPGAGAGTGIGAGGPGGNQGIDNGGDGDGIEEFTKDQRSDWEESIRLLQESVERWQDEIDKVPQALSDQEINMGVFDALYKYLEGSGKYAEQAHKYALMKVEIEFAAIKAQLIALGKWEEFAVMFNDAYNAARQEAGKPRGRGAGGGQRQEVRDFIKDKEFELALVGVSDYQRALAELNKQYDEMLAQAGKDKTLRAELIALRDREIQQLEEEKSKSTIANFQEFLGLVTPFDKVRKTAEDLIKQINDSPFGDARKGKMIARVLEEVNKQIEKMAKESALSLFSEMSADLERFGASQELQNQIQLQMAIIEHTLKMEHYRTEIEILRAQGKLAPEVLKALDDAFKFLEGINPADFLTPSAPPAGGPPAGYEWNGYDWVPTGQGEPENPFARAMELLNSYLEQDSDTFSAAIAKVHEDFAFIIDILGETPEVMSAYTDALERVREQFLGDLREFYDSLREGPDSSQTTAQQYASAESRFFELLNDDIDNMDQLDEIQDAGEIWRDLAAEMFGTSTGGFEDVISRLESALGPLLGIAPSGESSLSNLISGPAEWFQRSSDQTSDAIYDGTERMVDATTDVAEVLDFRSARQESILERISNGIDNLSFNISEFPNSPAGASYGG